MNRPILFLSFLLTLLFLPASAQNPGDNIFAGIQVHTIKLTLTQTNYWDSLVYYYNQGLEQYMVASAVVNDTITYDSIGVRLKGNSSFTYPGVKKSIRLAFDQYKSAYRWDGEKGIHLNNGWGDPSFIREKMHLDFCRDAGVIAPRANFAAVYINGTYWGLYSLVEHVDKTFLTTHYADKSGNLYKAVDGFGPTAQYFSDFKYYGTLADSYSVRYELKTDGSTTAWKDLMTVIDTVNNSVTPASSIPAVVNMTPFYKAMATDALFANLDSYLNSGRNFYTYFLPATKKMEWVVWDAGLSFGAYAPGIGSIENLSITYVSNAAARPLQGKVINTPSLKNEYLKTLSTLYTSYFTPSRLLPHADSLAAAIRSYVTADPNKMYTMQQFEANLLGTVTAVGGTGTSKPGIASFINNRATNVATQLAAANIDWTTRLDPGAVTINEFMASNDSILSPAGTAQDWIELYNNTANSITLGGLYLSDSYSYLKMWRIPDSTVIAANSTLIVWADEDTVTKSGLHAMFKLSASGERIVLANADTSVIDSVSFGAQLANVSLSRVPNGTGSFFPTKATFNAVNSAAAILASPTLTTVLLPQVIEGQSGTNTNRLPFVYRAKIFGLLPSVQYRFTNQIVISTDLSTAGGSGNCLYVSTSGDFIRSSSPSLATAGAYGSFTTDANGAYEGWFANEPTGNARFVPGKFIFPRISLNDGAGGTSAVFRLTAADSVRVLKLDASSADSTGTGLRCTSDAPAKDLVFAYDTVSGTGRPVTGSFVESDGTDNSTTNSYASFYSASVNGNAGAFGFVVPNLLPKGIRRIERRSLSTGAVTGIAKDADGIWPSGMGTVNPSGGTTEIVLASSDVSLLTGVAAAAKKIPMAFGLEQNFPNPFNPSTVIRYALPANAMVTLIVHDILGNTVATLAEGPQNAGTHEVTFDARRLASGLYFYRLQAGSFTQTKRMLLIK